MLEKAADELCSEYKNNKELTSFTSLDGESFYEDIESCFTCQNWKWDDCLGYTKNNIWCYCDSLFTGGASIDIDVAYGVSYEMKIVTDKNFRCGNYFKCSEDDMERRGQESYENI